MAFHELCAMADPKPDIPGRPGKGGFVLGLW